ncbi:hypothetical protein DAI22_05g150400 [Oryza sativa Japonica Group]|nr:hypothetical protein DAI22_05g150400 [Oryza sativa Japonica Group]
MNKPTPPPPPLLHEIAVRKATPSQRKRTQRRGTQRIPCAPPTVARAPIPLSASTCAAHRARLPPRLGSSLHSTPRPRACRALSPHPTRPFPYKRPGPAETPMPTTRSTQFRAR